MELTSGISGERGEQGDTMWLDHCAPSYNAPVGPLLHSLAWVCSLELVERFKFGSVCSSDQMGSLFHGRGVLPTLASRPARSRSLV